MSARIFPRSDRTILLRPNSTDADVVREIWRENVYHVAPGDFVEHGVAIDVGANIGAFALFAAHCGARRVLAYEPERDNFGALGANVAAHPAWGKAVLPICAAVHAQAGRVSIRGEHGNAHVVEGGAEGQDVRSLTLDDVFRENAVTACDVLKLDVEGSEYPIFESASAAAMARCRRIVMEFHTAPDAVFGALAAKLTRTHKYFVLGSVDRGGYIWAERY